MDTDQNDMVQVTAGGLVNKELGLVYTDTQYKTSSAEKYNAGTLSLVSDYKRDNYWIEGNAGISSMNSKTYFTGDMTGHTYFWSPGIKYDLMLGVYGDIVDSPLGLKNEITTTGVVGGAEVSGQGGGLVALARIATYTNNNTQNGFFVKGYVNIADGVNFYLSTKQYKNSSPFNGLYYSPDLYQRANAGLGFRKRIDGLLVFGKVEFGKAKVSGVTTAVNAWNLNAEYKVGKQWVWTGALGSDVGSSDNYQYKYFNIKIEYLF